MTDEAGLTAAAEEVLGGLLALSPASLRLAKAAMAGSLARPTGDEIFRAERFYVEHLMHTPDAVEGLRAFMEKRPPRWGGRPAEPAGPA